MTNKLFVRIMGSYLLLCMIPIITGFVAYRQAASSAEHQAQRVTSVMLERVSAAMDSAFDTIESVATGLSINSDIMRMVSSRPLSQDSAAYSRMYDARQALSDNKWVNENLLDLMLYCEKSGALITTSRIFMDVDRFYDSFFRYGDMNREEWQELVLDDPAYDRYFPAREILVRTGTGESAVDLHNAILYTRSVRTSAGRGRLIASVSMESLSDALCDILRAYGGGGILIFDARGNELAALGAVDDDIREGAAALTALDEGQAFASQGETLLVSARSALGWSFVAALDSAAVFGDLNLVKFTVWMMIGAEVLLLAMLAVLFARRSIKPVKGLIELMDGDEQDANTADSFDYLRQMITLMKQNYQRASSRLGAQTLIIRRQLLSSRLRGDMPEGVLRDSFERAQLRYPEDDAAVALLLIDGERDSDGHPREDLAKLLLSEQLDGLLGDAAACTRLDDGRYAVIFFDGSDTETQQQLLERINAALADAGCPCPVVSVCPPDGERTLCQRYTRADIRIHRWDAEPGVVDWIGADTELRSIGIHYSVKVEERLIRSIKNGSPSELKAVLDKVIDQNSISVRENKDVLGVITSAFRLTCARAQREAQFTPSAGERDVVNIDPESAISHVAPLEDFYAWCMRAAEQIERQRRHSGAGRSVEPVCDFLNENYADKQLSLAMVAERFGLSETYFSRLFKSQKGEAYSEYLERVRISHACDLLSQGESVDGTADKVGYNSVTVFRAAFKRMCGVTPSEYKSAISRAESEQ